MNMGKRKKFIRVSYNTLTVPHYIVIIRQRISTPQE